MSGQPEDRRRDARVTAMVGIVLLTPLVLVGILWTLSLFGAYVGAPILILTIPAMVGLCVVARDGTRPELYVLATLGLMVASAVFVALRWASVDQRIGGVVWLVAFLGCLARLRHRDS